MNVVTFKDPRDAEILQRAIEAACGRVVELVTPNKNPSGLYSIIYTGNVPWLSHIIETFYGQVWGLR